MRLACSATRSLGCIPPPGVGARHESLQALRDAIDVRAMLFDTLPDVETADFSVYRETASHVREMIITGLHAT